ncbi:hypothetical protein GGX14DRAFT_401154 [Mycena pura]|uniref:Uncharacterized protein n=1 Tax=Mycena pura TaxID=153505 RepID=A0AAD6V1D8_9AGAR|nr:hypothetical protein GGX14DRAFT_401154 [Mycena pura]
MPWRLWSSKSVKEVQIVLLRLVALWSQSWLSFVLYHDVYALSYILGKYAAPPRVSRAGAFVIATRTRGTVRALAVAVTAPAVRVSVHWHALRRLKIGGRARPGRRWWRSSCLGGGNVILIIITIATAAETGASACKCHSDPRQRTRSALPGTINTNVRQRSRRGRDGAERMIDERAGVQPKGHGYGHGVHQCGGSMRQSGMRAARRRVERAGRSLSAAAVLGHDRKAEPVDGQGSCKCMARGRELHLRVQDFQPGNLMVIAGAAAWRGWRGRGILSMGGSGSVGVRQCQTVTTCGCQCCGRGNGVRRWPAGCRCVPGSEPASQPVSMCPCADSGGKYAAGGTTWHARRVIERALSKSQAAAAARRHGAVCVDGILSLGGGGFGVGVAMWCAAGGGRVCQGGMASGFGIACPVLSVGVRASERMSECAERRARLHPPAPQCARVCDVNGGSVELCAVLFRASARRAAGRAAPARPAAAQSGAATARGGTRARWRPLQLRAVAVCMGMSGVWRGRGGGEVRGTGAGCRASAECARPWTREEAGHAATMATTGRR